jgi:hypothetical protein
MENVTAPAPSVSSFAVRATNVFASPGELYSEVALAPVQSSSWLIPYLLGIVIALIFTFALYNNVALRQEIFDAQAKEMQKQLDAGQLTQEQYDQATERMQSVGPMMFILFGGISAAFMISVIFFLVPLILWLAAKFILKYNGNYKKILETFGLASLIGAVGAIVTLLMMYMFNTMQATPGAGLLVLGSFDRENFGHNFLASLNIFTLWESAVIGIGLAKLSGKSTGMSMGVVFGLWLIWVLISSSLGWGGR